MSDTQDQAPRLPGDSQVRDQSRDSYKDMHSAECGVGWGAVLVGSWFPLLTAGTTSSRETPLHGVGREALAWRRGRAVSTQLSSCPSGAGCFDSGVQGCFQFLSAPGISQECLFCVLLVVLRRGSKVGNNLRCHLDDVLTSFSLTYS